MKNVYQRRKRSREFFLFRLILFLIVVFGGMYWFFLQVDEQIFETVIEISHMQSKAYANDVIDQAVDSVIRDMSVSSDDFFSGETGGTPALSANTLLINRFCSSLSEHITKGILGIEEDEILIPLGRFTGFEVLANRGPRIPFTLRPMGSALVDYDTDVSSVGINQISFKIWIDIGLQIKIVNPLRQETITLSRKIMLVDTILSGTVPERYLQISP